MSGSYDYKQYAKQPSIEDYSKYQQKYAEQPRFSDSAILNLIAERLGDANGDTRRLIDIGCSTGNLLGHLRRRFPGMKLTGGDLTQSFIEKCKGRDDLKGIDFDLLDITDMRHERQFNFAVTNAVTYLFDWGDYGKAIRSIAKALVPGGVYIAFEWFHPFVHQDIQIYETTVFNPKGIRIAARPYPKVERVLVEHGFRDIEFRPFVLPIELPMAGFDQEVTTYTVKSADGQNLPFRGALFQPWCHLVAVKG